MFSRLSQNGLMSITSLMQSPPQRSPPNIDANTSSWVNAALVLARRPGCPSITERSPLRLNILKIENSPPERVDVVRF